MYDESSEPSSTAPLEECVAKRIEALLARTGDLVSDLHRTTLEQVERGLLRAALAHTGGHVARAAALLGLDRNTCARKARAFGLMGEPSRGRKPKPPPR